MKETRVVISVSGGVVNAVCADGANLKVHLVDFDNLRQDASIDCSEEFPVDSIDEFCEGVKGDVGRYPGLAKLVGGVLGK
jgi:hypothetical protein